MIYLLIGLFSIVIGSSVAGAEATNFRQQILPINCLYEVVNVGTQQLRYITPETCPIDPGPPVVTEPSSEGAATVQTSGAITTQPNWSARSFVNIVRPIAPLSQPVQRVQLEEQSVKGTIERIEESVVNSRDAIVFTAFFGISGALFYSVVIRRYNRRIS